MFLFNVTMKFIPSTILVSTIKKLDNDARDRFFEKANRHFFDELQENSDPAQNANIFFLKMRTEWIFDQQKWLSVCKAAQTIHINLIQNIKLPSDSPQELEEIRLQFVKNMTPDYEYEFVEQNQFVSAMKKLPEEVQRSAISEANDAFYSNGAPQNW